MKNLLIVSKKKMKKNGADFRIKRGPMSREKKGSQSSKPGLFNITSQDLARVLKTQGCARFPPEWKIVISGTLSVRDR